MTLLTKMTGLTYAVKRHLTDLADLRMDSEARPAGMQRSDQYQASSANRVSSTLDCLSAES